MSEIEGMQLDENAKAAAISEQKRLANAALRETADNPNPFSTGRARTNVARNQRGADEISRANAAMDSHMRGMRDEAAKSARASAQKRRADAVKAAIDSGALEFTLDGATYRRKSRRGRSFTRVE